MRQTGGLDRTESAPVYCNKLFIAEHMRDDRVDAATARLYLKDVDPLWRAFWFHMHLMAKNLKEFGEGIGTVSDEVFAYHCGGEKNDIARWIREVIGDVELARELDTVPSQAAASTIVRERVAVLERAAKE